MVNQPPRKSDFGPVKESGSSLPGIVFSIDFKGTEWSYYDLQVVHSGKEIEHGLWKRKKKKQKNQVSCTGIYCRLAENS